MDSRQPSQKRASRLDEFAQAARARTAKGWTGRVPSLSVGHGWWVTVIDSTADGKFLKVKGGTLFGRSRWVNFADLDHPKPPRPPKANTPAQ